MENFIKFTNNTSIIYKSVGAKDPITFNKNLTEFSNSENYLEFKSNTDKKYTYKTANLNEIDYIDGGGASTSSTSLPISYNEIIIHDNDVKNIGCELNKINLNNCDEYKLMNGYISGISPIKEEEEVKNFLTDKNDENKIDSNTNTNNDAANNVFVSNAKRDTSGMTLNLNGLASNNSNKSISPSRNDFVKENISNIKTIRAPQTPNTPRTPSTSTTNFQPNKLTPKTPPVTPDQYIYEDDDIDSVYSYSSGRSTMSCDHPYVARNGTTFSGRKMKYVVHCSAYAGQVGADYLTPTQRAQKQLRRLKELLTQARQDVDQKDSELLRLTREVVELRLFKASLSSPEDKSNSSDAVTVREAPTDLQTSQDVSPIVDMVDDGLNKSSPKNLVHGIHQVQYLQDKMSNSSNSFADSGHFEDMGTVSSTQDQACGSDCIKEEQHESYEEQRAELIRMYEKRIEELIQIHDNSANDVKQTHNDRVEKLLQKLAECNTRYADLVPDHEVAKERIRELEKQVDDLQHKLIDYEEKQNKLYMHMYQKNEEAERIAVAEQALEIAHRQSNRVSLSELLQQLQSTQDELENIRTLNHRDNRDCPLLTAKEAISLWVLGARKTIYRRLIEAQANKTKVDPEVTLQFLKSAIYYFLTDKENSQGHLKAIESILEFSEQEKLNISKARVSK